MGALWAFRPPSGRVGSGVTRAATGVCQELPRDVDVWVILAVASSVLLVACAVGWVRDALLLAKERRWVKRLVAANAELRRQVIQARAELLAERTKENPT